MEEEKIYIASVSQVNKYLKQIMDKNKILSDMWIKGEISNCKLHYSGHLYLTLKDEGGVLKAVMFKGSLDKVTFVPEDGMKIMARGRISVYEKGGAYQLYIEEMQPDGVGSLHIAFEQMKNRLEEEGLFSTIYKKPLPKYPKTVGVVTASTGAAVRDVIHVLGRRAPYTKVLLYPSLVQGDGAAKNICAAIEYFNENDLCDVLIVGRGGGSIEDLWAFNEEIVARAIFGSVIPIISAVGHETDFTIADFVADLRAPTPSAAAEMACTSVESAKEKLSSLIDNASYLLSSTVKAKRAGMDRIVLKNPTDRINNFRINVDMQSKDIIHSMNNLLGQKKKELSLTTSKLNAINPLEVLGRGYCVAMSSDGKVISRASMIHVGDAFELVLNDGIKNCKVIG